MNEFKDDLDIIIQSLDISSKRLANDLFFDEPTLCNWLNGKFEPDPRSKEDIYTYAYEKGLRLNEAYEKPLSDLGNNQGFIHLYHGSRTGLIGDINLDKSFPHNDLGRGFYLGENLSQSAMFVSDNHKSKVYSFGLYPKKLKIKKYEVDDEWIFLVSYNRNLLNEYKDSDKIKKIIKDANKYDVIIAPIADNRMFDIIREFVDSNISIESCKYALAALDLGKQYVLKTEKAVNSIGLIKEYYLCKKEKQDYIIHRNTLQSKRIQEIKNFRSKFKTGHYIEELL